MTQSVFEKKTLANIYEEICKVYLSDKRPWILGFSGGKDSTCMVQLVWYALSELPKEKLHKKVYVISSDTLVETPPIIERIKGSLQNISDSAKKNTFTNIHEFIRTKTFGHILGKTIGSGISCSNFYV